MKSTIKTFFLQKCWFCLYAIQIGIAVVLITILWNWFLLNPTVTSLDSAYYPVNAVEFPGISVCSINKISKRRAEMLGEQLANKTGSDREEMIENVRFLGRLYDFDFKESDFSRVLSFQSNLDSLNANIITLTRMLATPCADLLKNCRWKGVEFNCSDLFHLRLSHDGFCCIFNYIKHTRDLSNATVSRDPLYGTDGLENGLSFLINNDVEDYFYTTVASEGAFVQAFVPSDYPDKSSGDLNEILIQTGSENFLEITPTTFYSVQDIINYPVSSRNCLFDVERQTTFDGIYSQSDCNVDCRVRSMLALCQCIPFMIPLSQEDTVCTLADLACLNKYKDKWNSLAHSEDAPEGLNMEKQNSLRCENVCFPSCSGTIYEVSINSVQIGNVSLVGKHNSIVHIFYANRFSILYKQDVVYYWFEILSNFGGLVSLVTGFSLITIVEMVIFALQYLKHLWRFR